MKKMICLLVASLVMGVAGCAGTQTVHILPKGEYMEVQKDGKVAYVQTLFKVDLW